MSYYLSKLLIYKKRRSRRSMEDRIVIMTNIVYLFEIYCYTSMFAKKEISSQRFGTKSDRGSAQNQESNRLYNVLKRHVHHALRITRSMAIETRSCGIRVRISKIEYIIRLRFRRSKAREHSSLFLRNTKNKLNTRRT